VQALRRGWLVTRQVADRVHVRYMWGFWWGKLRERNHLEDPGLDGRIILTL